MKRFTYTLSTLFLMSFLFSTGNIIAQEDTQQSKSDFWKKVRFGGGLGLNFGNNATNITVAPSALYQPNQYIAFGPGLNYTYQRFGDTRTTLIGGSAIILANPLDFLQLSGELEQLRVTQRFDGGADPDPFWNTALFLGGGYRLNVGGNSLGAIGVRYNVLFRENEGIYQSAWQPFVRVFF